MITYKRNRGRGHARTEALKAAIGKWLVVWDVDDIYFPDRLEQNHQALLEGYDFCCSYVILIDNAMQVLGTRGLFPYDRKSICCFTHPSMGCKLELAQNIGYDPTLPAGEDASLMVTLAHKYNGLWIKDTLTMYQENREVNIHKTISSNRGQLASMKILYKKRILELSRSEYVKMIVKWGFKLSILHLFRSWPSLYLKTVALRKAGETDTEWVITNDRK